MLSKISQLEPLNPYCIPLSFVTYIDDRLTRILYCFTWSQKGGDETKRGLCTNEMKSSFYKPIFVTNHLLKKINVRIHLGFFVLFFG